MTYGSGQLIENEDFNTFATGSGDGTSNPNVPNINTIYNIGVLDKGWGVGFLFAVSGGATISAANWATMFSWLTIIANHTNTPITALTNPVAGDLIDWKANFSSNLTDCFNNRNNAFGVGSTITAGGVATRTTSWTASLTATHTITFVSANAARYFFNAGGRITWAGARSGGGATNQNTAWTNLLTACGTLNWTTGTSTQNIAGAFYEGTTKTGGSGSPSILSSGVGFYDFTTTDQLVFRQFDTTYLYTANYVDINVRANAAAGSATQVIITVSFVDAQGLPGDLVDGTLTSTVTLVQPSTTYITNTWGTPTISSSITGS